MKLNGFTITIGIALLVIVGMLFAGDWEVGVYFILTMILATVVAFANQSTNTRLLTSTTIIISVFALYRLFLVSLKFWFMPKFYNYWVHEMSAKFWFAHTLLALGILVHIALNRYASASKATSYVPKGFYLIALLITIYTVARFGYDKFGNEAVNIVLPSEKEERAIDLKKDVPFAIDIKETDHLKISYQTSAIFIITANKDTAIKEPYKNERFIYQSTATTHQDDCGSGEWYLLSKTDQKVAIKIY